MFVCLFLLTLTLKTKLGYILCSFRKNILNCCITKTLRYIQEEQYQYHCIYLYLLRFYQKIILFV